MTKRDASELREMQARELRMRFKGNELAQKLKKLDRDIINQLTENLLLEARGDELGISVNDADINSRVAGILKREPGLRAIYSEKSLKELVIKDMVKKQVINREVDARVHVSQKAINKQCLAASGGAQEVNVGHILVRGHSPKAERKIKALRRKLLGGAVFEKLAQTQSEDPSAKKNKGRLGFAQKGQFFKPFEKAAFSMKKGELSKPVKTKLGFHLIKVFALRTKGKTDCSNLTAKDRKQYQGQVYSQLRTKRYAEFMEDLKDKAEIRIIKQ